MRNEEYAEDRAEELGIELAALRTSAEAAVDSLEADVAAQFEQLASSSGEFEDMVESFRVMVARPELWGQDFSVSLAYMLTPEERMAIPGEVSKIVW